MSALGRANSAVVAFAAGPDASEPTVRVLLRRSGAVDSETVVIESEGAATLRDLGSDAKVASVSAYERVSVGREGQMLWVRVGNGRRSGLLDGPVSLEPSEAGSLMKAHLDEPANAGAYRGRFEVRASTTDGRVCLVNVVPLEIYLAGVVPREMPEPFGLEPARAQAIAARGFAVARSANSTHRDLSADVCNGVDCQVYGGASAERALATEAVGSTRGAVLWRSNKIITPMYSSTCGGHTESLARMTGQATTIQQGPWIPTRIQRDPCFPAALFAATPRDAVADGALPKKANLATDEGAGIFLTSTWDSHCVASARYRWSVAWDRAELEAVLNAGLKRLASSRLVYPTFGPDGSIGRLERLAVVQRGVSGRVGVFEIVGTGGAWTVSRDWTIRNLLRGPSGAALPSAAFVVELERGAGRELSQVRLHGGGFGHGVGMCQWGARGLAEMGKSAEEILAHYYPETALRPLA